VATEIDAKLWEAWYDIGWIEQTRRRPAAAAIAYERALAINPDHAQTVVGLVDVYEIDRPDLPLINISTRGKVQTGFDVMIGGFVVTGTGSQTVVIRAIGPSLANYGVAGALPNPTMQLVRISDSAVIATNDDWQGGPNAGQIQAAGFAPTNPLESAIMVTLSPGAYTAIVSGVNGGVGVGLVEVYAVGP